MGQVDMEQWVGEGVERVQTQSGVGGWSGPEPERWGGRYVAGMDLEQQGGGEGLWSGIRPGAMGWGTRCGAPSSPPPLSPVNLDGQFASTYVNA